MMEKYIRWDIIRSFLMSDCRKDFLPMYLSKQIRVIYDCTDMITEYLTDYYNSYSQETYDIIPVTTCDLSPETEELFHMDDYPERFFKWAEKFINITV